MITTVPAAGEAARLLRGRDGWWYLGRGARALLKPEHVGPHGELRADVAAALRARTAFHQRAPEAYSLTVLTATDCPLACAYCFQNTGGEEPSPTGSAARPTRIPAVRLDAARVDRIVEFTKDRMAQAGLSSVNLLLFGGEPLLEPAVCLALLRGLGRLGLRDAAVTTSGLPLTVGLARELAAAGLREVQLTFDGGRDAHDRVRVRRDGRGTYDMILRKAEAVQKVSGLRIRVRINLARGATDGIDTLIRDLAIRLDPPGCEVYFALIGEPADGGGHEAGGELPDPEAIVRWTAAALDAGFRVPVPGAPVECGICGQPGGRYGAVVSADGALYSCTQSAGRPELAVGTLVAGYAPVDEVRDNWLRCGYGFAELPQMAEFEDRVDALVLDHLNASGRLKLTPNTAARVR